MSDIKQALNIPRTTLIKRLTEVRDEEIQKREDAQREADDRRKTLLDEVEKLTTDQVANVLHHYVLSNVTELEKWVKETVENDKFVSKDAAPTPKEHTLDKTIRVLEMASDTDIKVEPSDSVYQLI